MERGAVATVSCSGIVVLLFCCCMLCVVSSIMSMVIMLFMDPFPNNTTDNSTLVLYNSQTNISGVYYPNSQTVIKLESDSLYLDAISKMRFCIQSGSINSSLYGIAQVDIQYSKWSSPTYYNISLCNNSNVSLDDGLALCSPKIVYVDIYGGDYSEDFILETYLSKCDFDTEDCTCYYEEYNLVFYLSYFTKITSSVFILLCCCILSICCITLGLVYGRYTIQEMELIHIQEEVN